MAISAVPTLIPVHELSPATTASTGVTPNPDSRSREIPTPAKTVPETRRPQERGTRRGESGGMRMGADYRGGRIAGIRR